MADKYDQYDQTGREPFHWQTGIAYKTADKIVILYMGKVLAEGTPSEIRQSEDPLVQQFITGSPDGPLSFRASSKDYREDLLVG